MESWFSHASGIIISTECGSERPPRWSSSSTSSKDAESEASGVHTGKIRSMDFSSCPLCPWSAEPNRSETSCDSRARIQLRLPLTVLISPLCATKRYGCASGHDGKVFVEKREWTSDTAEAKRRSDRSGKKGSS